MTSLSAHDGAKACEQRSARSGRLRNMIIPLALLTPAAVIFLFFVGIPFVGVVIVSFHTSLTDASFTVAHYTQFLTDAFYIGVIANTISTSIVVTFLSLLLGYPLALYVAFARDRWRRYLILAILSPLLISVVVRSYALSLLLSPNNPIDRILPFGWNVDIIFTRGAVIVGLVYTLLPFMMLSILSSLSSIDLRLITAAQSLGASAFTSFRRIVVPLSIQGVFAGCLIVFTLSMTSFALPLLLGGASYKMLVSLIYTEILVLFDWPAGYAVSIVLLFVTGVILVIGKRFVRQPIASF